tara:strand:- start:30447 stop:30689 length:243 start_codon:yes stop_codon:yes gene_type:complete
MSKDANPLYIISVPGKEAGSMLDKLPLNGKKTYVVAIVTVVYAICGILLGDMATNDAIMLIAGALGLSTIGHKIDKTTTN